MILLPDSVILEAGVGNFSEYGLEEFIIGHNSCGEKAWGVRSTYIT